MKATNGASDLMCRRHDGTGCLKHLEEVGDFQRSRNLKATRVQSQWDFIEKSWWRLPKRKVGSSQKSNWIFVEEWWAYVVDKASFSPHSEMRIEFNKQFIKGNSPHTCENNEDSVKTLFRTFIKILLTRKVVINTLLSYPLASSTLKATIATVMDPLSRRF